MMYQVMFVFSHAHYDEIDSEYDDAYEAEKRLKELYYAGFSGSYIKTVRGTVQGKSKTYLHATPLFVILANGVPIKTEVTFKNKWEAEDYFNKYITMYRGVTYEIHEIKRFKMTSTKILPIDVKNPQKAELFNAVVEDSGNENYCGGY
jgi:hypothetical protein